MTDQILTYSEKLGYSRLFIDFIYQPDKLSGYFKRECDAEQAHTLAVKAGHRAAMAEILRRQNRQWSAPERVFEAISKFENKKAVAVLTGQQACLFGGPYLVLLKAMGAVKLAQKVENELGVPVVPIFWIAADDHDFAEIAAASLLDASGALTRLRIDYEPERNYSPVGALTYDESITREIEKLASLLPENDFKNDVLGQIVETYNAGKHIADCFAEYLTSLVGHLGIAMFNPYDEQFKQLAVPMMQGIVTRHAEVKKSLSATGEKLSADGYHRQVIKTETAAHLFHHQPERTSLHRDGENFIAGDDSFTPDKLNLAIAERPLEFSPDVLTRPLVQSFAFPTAAVIGGPAEIAYYAQMIPLFDLYEMTAPAVYTRPSITIVEKRFEIIMDRHQITMDDLAGDIETIIKRVLRESYPEIFEEHLADFSKAARDGMNKLKEELAIMDNSLADAADRTGDKIDYQLRELGKKAFAAHRKKHKLISERIYRTRQNLFPDNGLAERSIIPAYFISRYGRTIIDFLYNNISIDETRHRLLMLSE